jgi:hypothetical protein
MGRLIPWLNWLPRRRWRIVARVEAADEVPNRLPRRGVVVAGPQSDPHWLVFDCPCRAGHRVMLNLDKRRRPHWNVVQDEPLTVRPSVDDHIAERRCHFILREGRIRWVPRHAEET